MPANPALSERFMTITFRAWSTSRIGIPAITESGSRAAGFTTSLAPTTSTTSVEANSGLISSRSSSCS